MSDGEKRSPACPWLSHCSGVGWGAQERCKGMGTQLMDELVRSPSHLPGCALAFAAIAALAGKCGKFLSQKQLWARSAGGDTAPDPTDSSPAPVLKPVRLVLPGHTGSGSLEAQ